MSQTRFGEIGETGQIRLEYVPLNVEQVEMSNRRIRQGISLLLHSTNILLGSLQNMGLGKEADEIIGNIQRLMIAINMLNSTIYMLYVASGPIGWAFAAVGVASNLMMGLNEVGRSMKGQRL